MDINKLKKNHKIYSASSRCPYSTYILVTRILEWQPNGSVNKPLKIKALSCLTERRRELAYVLITSAVRDVACMAGNGLRHPRTSRPFAKATVRQVFKELELGTAHPRISFAHFDDVIENAPLPLGGNDPRPLILEQDEDVDSPPILEKKIIHLGGTDQTVGGNNSWSRRTDRKVFKSKFGFSIVI